MGRHLRKDKLMWTGNGMLSFLVRNGQLCPSAPITLATVRLCQRRNYVLSKHYGGTLYRSTTR